MELLQSLPLNVAVPPSEAVVEPRNPVAEFIAIDVTRDIEGAALPRDDPYPAPEPVPSRHWHFNADGIRSTVLPIVAMEVVIVLVRALNMLAMTLVMGLSGPWPTATENVVKPSAKHTPYRTPTMKSFHNNLS